jgi:hypothetical protein
MYRQNRTDRYPRGVRCPAERIISVPQVNRITALSRLSAVHALYSANHSRNMSCARKIPAGRGSWSVETFIA